MGRCFPPADKDVDVTVAVEVGRDHSAAAQQVETLKAGEVEVKTSAGCLICESVEASAGVGAHDFLPPFKQRVVGQLLARRLCRAGLGAPTEDEQGSFRIHKPYGLPLQAQARGGHKWDTKYICANLPFSWRHALERLCRERSGPWSVQNYTLVSS